MDFLQAWGPALFPQKNLIYPWPHLYVSDLGKTSLLRSLLPTWRFHLDASQVLIVGTSPQGALALWMAPLFLQLCKLVTWRLTLPPSPPSYSVTKFCFLNIPSMALGISPHVPPTVLIWVPITSSLPHCAVLLTVPWRGLCGLSQSTFLQKPGCFFLKKKKNKKQCGSEHIPLCLKPFNDLLLLLG